MSSSYDKIVAWKRQLCLLRGELASYSMILLSVFFLSNEVCARAPGESDFLAASLTSEDIATWIEKLETRPSSIGIFSVRVASVLDENYAHVMETEIIKQLRNKNLVKVISCPECKAPQVKVNGDRLVITKGAPELEALKELGKKMGTESFLVVDIYRTPLSVITNATLYHTSSGEVISAERFKVPALDFSDAAMQFIFAAGSGATVGGKAKSSDFPLEVNLLFLEELGFGKGGINIGGIFAGSQGILGYVQPTIGWRKRFGGSAITSLFRVGAGFGFLGREKGISGQLAYDVFIGSFTVVGVDGVGFFPVQGRSSSFNSYLGVHIGFALGR